MDRISEEQQNLLWSKIVSIDHKNTDFYAWGRNTRIVVGDKFEAAQRIIGVGEYSSEEIDMFFEGYWNGLDNLE